MGRGHGTLRNLSGIKTDKNPDPEKINSMLSMLDETLKYTFGLSTGLEYSPGLNAKSAELKEIAKVVGKNNRLIMSHMRNEDDDELESSINVVPCSKSADSALKSTVLTSTTSVATHSTFKVASLKE